MMGIKPHIEVSGILRFRGGAQRLIAHNPITKKVFWRVNGHEFTLDEYDDSLNCKGIPEMDIMYYQNKSKTFEWNREEKETVKKVLVAKRYKDYRQIGEVYTVEDKDYIVVVNKDEAKAVRVYTQKQYDFLSGMAYQQQLDQEAKDTLARSFNEERMENAGFKEGYIVVILGDTYKDRQQLKDLGAKYNSQFKWHFEGGHVGTKSKALYKFDTRVITWGQASETLENGVVRLKPNNELKKLLRPDVKEDSNSEYLGVEGESIILYGRVLKALIIDGDKGRHCMHIISDSKDNILIWNSSIANMLDEKIYKLEVEVAHHGEYNGVKQTTVSRLEVI